MINIHAEVKKWGNSLAFIIPAEKAEELGISAGEHVDAEIRKCERIDGFGLFKGAKPFVREKDSHDARW